MRTDAYEDEPRTQRDPEQLPDVKKNGNMPSVILVYCYLIPVGIGMIYTECMLHSFI